MVHARCDGPKFREPSNSHDDVFAQLKRLHSRLKHVLNSRFEIRAFIHGQLFVVGERSSKQGGETDESRRVTLVVVV